MELGLRRRGEASPLRTSPGPGTSRVVVPYTNLRPEVIWALQESEHDYEPVDVSADDEAYWRLLARLWDEQESFTIVEHDIVVQAGTLDSFDACDQPWCVAKYPYLGGRYWGLGCTRFAASLLRAFPDLMSAVRWYDAPGHGPAHWCTLDVAVTAQLHRRLREWPHVHGTVEHLSKTPTHGCRG